MIHLTSLRERVFGPPQELFEEWWMEFVGDVPEQPVGPRPPSSKLAYWQGLGSVTPAARRWKKLQGALKFGVMARLTVVQKRPKPAARDRRATQRMTRVGNGLTERGAVLDDAAVARKAKAVAAAADK